MKKLQLLLLVFIFGSYNLFANPVTPEVAKTVAQGFYAKHTQAVSPVLSLIYTERSSTGQAVFYVYNVNTNDGFVIVSAEDATHPILGYSTTGHYVEPAKGTNIDFWMQTKKGQILSIRSKNYSASSQIADEWTSYATNAAPHYAPKRFSSVMSVLPLCQSTWDQPSPYNNYCPGGSVTGCVATAMAQIMRYWSYPPHGIGSSCYDDVSPPYSDNWGMLCADYDTSKYVWSAMPYSVSSNNNEVAKLMYDCGVSVDMDYTPTGSGAQVLGGNPSAQYSYVTYFGYNSATLNGVYQSSYSASAWTNLIENELNNSRLVQYAGFDGVYGGHTWVCDGYDAINDFHMNWGWSGADDGYYNVDSLNPHPYDFINDEQILYGIEPPPALALFTASPTSGCGPLSVTFTDQSMVSAPSVPITSWAWTFSGGTPSTSSLQNPTVTFSTPGTYAVTLTVTNRLGNNTLTKTSYITVNGSNNLSLVQGFEGSFPPSQWAINNPNSHATTWAQSNYGIGGFGSSNYSMVYNNCSGGVVGERDQIYTPMYNFNNVTNPILYFDVAYTPYDVTSTPPESDTLAVYYSTDCGQTFTRIYLKGGMNLCTNGGTPQVDINPNGCFVPTSGNWRTDSIHIPAIAGNSSVVFSFENRSGNGTNMYVDNINIPGAPLTSFKVNDSIICLSSIDSVQYLDQSTNSPSHWSWTFPGGNPSTSTLQNPWVKYTTAGNYTGTLRTTNGQGSDSLTKTNYVNVRTCTGIQDISNGNSMNLYPNPAKDEFTVQLNGTTKAALIELYNITGQVVLSNKLPEGQSFIVNTKDITNGVYILKVSTQDGATLVQRVEIIK